MNKWFKTVAYLVLLLLLTAEDCSDSGTELSREDRQSQMFLDIENRFEEKQLTEEDLTVFENRSLQMLCDLIDYINIYADSSLLKEFRIQSRQMIDNFFITDAQLDSFLLKLNLVEDEKNAILLFNGMEPFNLKLDSQYIAENFSQQSDLTFSGRIKFGLSSSINDFKLQGINLDIHLKKSKKQFGEKTKEVWGVLFGSIN